MEVSVFCVTYNHERYIRQCLDSIISQKTNFDFELIVHDDASTDGTSAIIKEYSERYPDKIKSISQKDNQYSKGMIDIPSCFMLSEAKGKYIALCEGDDYWCDQEKLQRQYEAMETNPECGMAVHRSYIAKESGEITAKVIPPCKYWGGYMILDGQSHNT